MSSSNGLRQRHTPTEEKRPDSEYKPTKREEVVWGKTPGGEVFRVPTTHDVITTLLNPNYPKSDFDLLNLGLLGLQLVLFILFSRRTAQIFFLCYFAFWRATYDAGLGWVLTKQSKKKWIVKEVQRLGWLDQNLRPAVRDWIRKQLVGKMGKDYSFDNLPVEYNTWLLFRQAVDVILVNDFLSYCMFAFSCFRVPADLSIAVHVMRWVGGIALIGFNLWVKTEAHNVVKDYGWYWGDCFFQRGNLVFDGVFELAPHPMYSVGYAGYYGLSLISGSYAVLFVSLAAHAAQFGFLVFFENPHIERFYGQRKPIAKRIPIFPKPKSISGSPSKLPSTNGLTSPPDLETLTPAATEGETATETEIETEFDEEISFSPNGNALKRVPRHRTTLSADSIASSNGDTTPLETPVYNKIATRPRTSSWRTKAVSQHDLLNKYFKRDAVVLRNVDLLRATDAMLVLIVGYGLGFCFLPTLSPQGTLLLHFVHALTWCFVHYFGLGLLLRAQSESKFLVRHYLKNYHYPPDDGGQTALVEAFTNWKAIYNMSLCMCFVSCVGVAWKAYLFPIDWAVGNALLRHTIGLLLIGLHIWATMGSYEVLGIFGWFFGDFFMDEFPANLEYTGIYRYLDNPEAMAGAAYFGIALISASKLVLCLAVVRHLANWWFLSNVEHPHMRKLYGDSLRKDAGFVKVMKKVARKNAKIIESRAEKHAPELKKVAQEVMDTFDRVYEEAADAVEDFVSKSAPRISGVVRETQTMIKQSRQKFLIPLVADLSSYDTTKYGVSVVPSPTTGGLSFYLGDPITVRWQAPLKHSRKDWIGIYRIGANKSRLVTRISSLGLWLPIHDKEWDGDIPLGLSRPPTPIIDAENGTVVFKGNTLPWLVGSYEVRYHHDGKYNVMSMDGPIEIYVNKPLEPLTFASVRESLMHVVPLCLDSDPSLIPSSCKTFEAGNVSPPPTSDALSNSSKGTGDSDQEDRDPDDFSFWTERQAKRICIAIKQIFDVEYAPEVVVADANLTALANRILVSKEILSPSSVS